MAVEQRLVHFSGQVQGVGFRYTAVRLAGRHDVTGSVRNLPDGRVEIVVEGERDQIDSFLQAVRDRMGPYLEGETGKTSPPTGEFSGFDIRF